MFLKAHSSASKLDNPCWKEATQGKFANKYLKAMKLEIEQDKVIVQQE